MYLSLSQTSLQVLTCLQYNSFENTVGKGEIARNFSQFFPLFWRTLSHFHQLEICRLQTLLVWKNLKLVVWERVKIIRFVLDTVENKVEICQLASVFSKIFYNRIIGLLPLDC